MNGVCYVAYGNNAHNALRKSKRSLLKHNKIDVAVCSEKSPHLNDVTRYNNVQRSRWAKVNLDLWSPYEYTLYLDADTKINGSIMSGFDYLDNGWDVCIAPSSNQGNKFLHHCSEDDREATTDLVGRDTLQYQAGVFFFRKSDKVREFFKAWRQEWLRFEQQDQGALIRAMAKSPVSIMLLGNEWNSLEGGLITHLFGKAR